MSKKIRFKVSARTARLIGRENVSNAESALIELVKNSYDADANNCIIYFDSENRLHILDDGHGMTSDTIENHWMTIGTNNKELAYQTASGRIKSGEKGIGRFALDRLGQTCELWTKPENHATGYIWSADWADFEDEDVQAVEQIEAELTTRPKISLEKRTKEIFKHSESNVVDIFCDLSFDKGTLITIENLSDEWKHFHFNRLYNSLSTLIPPKEETSFEVYLFIEEFPEKFGKIDTGPCDDFDYKVEAMVHKNQKVTITITRNEYDLDLLEDDLFKQNGMKSFPYDKKTFYDRKFKKIIPINQLVPGFQDLDVDNTLKSIGPFSFIFYFMKRQAGGKANTEKYCYKSFNASTRKVWLDEFGGIKVFRDGFRVRPYGEPQGEALDWLGLGQRYAASPAAVSRKGGYRVREYNLSGTVNISRVKNPALRDKSSREGIRDNKEFEVFKQLLIGIINKFEDDRSYIASEMDLFWNKKNPKARTAEKAEKASNRYKSQSKSEKNKTETDKDIEVLTQHTEDLKEEIGELLNERKILRVLASSGSMFAAFGHELHAMQNDIKDRAATLRNLFEPYLDMADAVSIPDEFNPWVYVDEIEESDAKLLHWMNFALSGLKRDKRNRRKIYLEKYFKNLNKLWSVFIEEREIELVINCDDESLAIRAFGVELDTMFNNLILNSIESFSSKKKFKARKITITCSGSDENIRIHYKDTGIGLSKDLDDHNKIFDLYVSTKRDPNTGKLVGTGIGMYLVKSIVQDYDGNIAIGNPSQGFSLIISIPKHY